MNLRCPTRHNGLSSQASQSAHLIPRHFCVSDPLSCSSTLSFCCLSFSWTKRALDKFPNSMFPAIICNHHCLHQNDDIQRWKSGSKFSCGCARGWGLMEIYYQRAGVNICQKRSETVYHWFWGILKLSVMVDQDILKLSVGLLNSF